MSDFLKRDVLVTKRQGLSRDWSFIRIGLIHDSYGVLLVWPRENTFFPLELLTQLPQ